MEVALELVDFENDIDFEEPFENCNVDCTDNYTLADRENQKIWDFGLLQANRQEIEILAEIHCFEYFEKSAYSAEAGLKLNVVDVAEE